MQIALVSDIICPWCFIGKIRLENAIRSLQVQDRIALEISPFQLYPDIPLQGLPRASFPKKEGHGKQLRAAAEPLGLHFRWDLIKTVPNTFAIHENLFSLRKEDRWLAKQALFEAYFCEGKDLSQAEEVEAVLADFQPLYQEVRGNVLSLINDNRQRGITAAPSFIVDDEHILTGAIQQDRWKQFLQKRLLS